MKKGYRFQTALLFGITVGFLTIVELTTLMIGQSHPEDVIVDSSSSSSSTNNDDSSSSSSNNGYNEYIVANSTKLAPFTSVALQLLTITSVFIGMAVGSLLPRAMLGVSLGVGGALCVCAGVGAGVFLWVCGGLAVLCGGISCR